MKINPLKKHPNALKIKTSPLKSNGRKNASRNPPRTEQTLVNRLENQTEINI